MKIGSVVVDIQTHPARIGIVVAIWKQSFTVAHLRDFLSFESEHRWQILHHSECEFLADLSEDHEVVKKLIKEFKDR